MEQFRAQLVEGFSDTEIIPHNVYDLAVIVNNVLLEKFDCQTIASVENLTIKLKIISGIFVKKDFKELTDDIDTSKVSISFEEGDQTLSIFSNILH